jgi:hypothetical protein
MDLLVYYWSRTPVAFLHDRAAMNAAAFRPFEIVPGGEQWYTNAATFAGLDGDGHPDLVIGNYFEDGARILDANARGTEHMEHSMSRAFNAGRNCLLLWQGADAGSVTFCDTPGVLPDEVALGWTLAAGTACERVAGNRRDRRSHVARRAANDRAVGRRQQPFGEAESGYSFRIREDRDGANGAGGSEVEGCGGGSCEPVLVQTRLAYGNARRRTGQTACATGGPG